MGAEPDLTIALCLHREGGLLAPTLRSLAEAARFCLAAGLRVELVVVFDRADDATRAIYAQEITGFPALTRELHVEFGSLGLARNAAISAARGEFVALADGDDLVSFNCFSALYSAAAKAERVVVMPGALRLFGAVGALAIVPSLADVGALNLLSSNPFVSRICLRREDALAVPFTDASGTTGYAFEDWRHHCDLIAAGFDLQSVPDAALCYRQSAAGLNRSAERKGSAISASPLFRREIYLRRAAADYARWRAGAVAGARLAFARPFTDAAGRLAYAAAHRIEPEIPIEPESGGPLRTPFSAAHKAAGALYYQLCEALPERAFERVYLCEGRAAPRVGADALALAVGRTRGAPSVQIEAQSARATLLSDDETALRIALKLAQSFAPGADIHLRDSGFARRFVRRFAAGLARTHTLAFYADEREADALAGTTSVHWRDPSRWPT
jgi:glycosyltransferase involved in cell wall biosynthesis